MNAERVKTAILLLAHGTPESIDEIPEYLRNVTSGRALPEAAIAEIKHRYGLIGHSPLTELTFEQARLLSEKLGLPVYVGMRNWKPYIASTVRQMREDGVTAAAAICLAPQNSRTSVGLYRRAVMAEAGSAIAIDFTEGWAEHPFLIDAFAERLGTAWTKLTQETEERVPVLFTAHSVPCRTVQSAPAQPSAPGAPPQRATAAPLGPDPYAVEAKRTASLVAEKLRAAGLTHGEWFFAFQSQGISGGPWIGPTVEDTLKALRQAGHTVVMIQPIGFLCDHVEILYDIDIGFREYGKSLGLRVERPESLNASPRLTDALADLAGQGLQRLNVRGSELNTAGIARPVSA
ncbi:MAG: ferrochelatase [Acidobacteriaceae bacterium]